MKTLITSLLVMTLSSVLFAQVDSTITDSSKIELTKSAPEVTDSLVIPEVVDSLVTPDAEMAVTDSMDTAEAISDSTSLEIVTTDSTKTETVVLDTAIVDSSELAASDTSAISEPEMIMVSREPDSVKIAGLITQGSIYFWSNDALDGLGFDSLSYVIPEDPTLIAIKANDCLNIVCHLLATDSSDVDYVVVTGEDSTDYRIYKTDTKVVVIETPAHELAAAFDTYMRSLIEIEYIAVEEIVPTIEVDLTEGPVVDLPLSDSRAEALKIKRRQFRSMDNLFANPANLARDYDSFTSWNLLPNFNVSVQNSLLTPGWYKEWWTEGGVWDDAMKNAYLETVMDQDLAFNVSPDFHSLFGFRIGRFGLNLSGKSHIKVVLPGNLLGLPMQDIQIDEPIENGGLEIEVVPFVAKTTVSYAHPLSTPFGDLKVGMGVNVFEAAGYMKTVSDNFTTVLTQDSILVTASGEGWYTAGGIDGHLDDLDMDGFEANDIVSNPGFGIDLGLILDLQPTLKQEVELQFSLRNIGAQYKWSDITHEAWTFEQLMPAPGNADFDSIEQYQNTTTTVLGTDEEFSVTIPTVMNLNAFYQPLPKVLVGAGIEQAFTDEVQFGYSPDLEFSFQLNLYPFSWLDFSYYKQNRYGDPVHTFGSGFHFGFLDTGFTLSFFNGVNTNAKGIGFGLSSSLHF